MAESPQLLNEYASGEKGRGPRGHLNAKLKDARGGQCVNAGQ